MKTRLFKLPFKKRQKKAKVSFFERKAVVTKEYRYTLVNEKKQDNWSSLPISKPSRILTLKEIGIIGVFQIFAAIFITCLCMYFVSFELAVNIGVVCFLCGLIALPLLCFYLKKKTQKNTCYSWHKSKTFFQNIFMKKEKFSSPPVQYSNKNFIIDDEHESQKLKTENSKDKTLKNLSKIASSDC